MNGATTETPTWGINCPRFCIKPRGVNISEYSLEGSWYFDDSILACSTSTTVLITSFLSSATLLSASSNGIIDVVGDPSFLFLTFCSSGASANGLIIRGSKFLK